MEKGLLTGSEAASENGFQLLGLDLFELVENNSALVDNGLVNGSLDSEVLDLSIDVVNNSLNNNSLGGGKRRKSLGQLNNLGS